MGLGGHRVLRRRGADGLPVRGGHGRGTIARRTGARALGAGHPAGRLHLRRNTVRYRVQRAVELRGRPIDKDRLELEIALGACRRLGRAVLAPSPVGRDGA
ncbi:helix-turn-helix domain-containing protein [Streptomyces arboris]|uniref:PucR family transcriptional regulator n=1 Tax=Streptomyces arboris TaxID=2600619 RepID=A0A5N5EMC6_9ACTN|nr:PucR family transcriptional regulator [Streptomyces arboris]